MGSASRQAGLRWFALKYIIPKNMRKLGVVIGRFQVAELSDGHRALLDRAFAESAEVLVLIGSTESVGTKRNPMPYRVRAKMLIAAYPQAMVHELPDHPSDGAWADTVDRAINAFLRGTVALYFGHESGALQAYRDNGAYSDIREVDVSGPHGEELRAAVMPIDSADFRAGMIYQTQQQFPVSYQVIDVLVYRPDTDEVLFGRKANEPKGLGRLIGGFVDPGDSSLEVAVTREVSEECGLSIGNIRYAGSATINDWRYRGGPESIKSAVFVVDRLWGHAGGQDDIAEVFWCPRADAMSRVLPLHAEILSLALTRLEKDRMHEPVATD